jgi:hypothetical protein
MGNDRRISAPVHRSNEVRETGLVDSLVIGRIVDMTLDKINPKCLQANELRDDGIDQWVEQCDASPKHGGPKIGSPEGSIRLVICHRPNISGQIGFCISKNGYASVEKAFSLPLQTLPNLGNRWGTFSSEIQPGPNGSVSIGKAAKLIQTI